jgi:hypothetical protein
MFRPTAQLQLCFGLSSIVLSFGCCWSLISGAWVKVSIAGANISVNQKLEKVEKIATDLTDTATQLKSEPSVSPLKLKAIEQELRQVESEINRAENKVEQELDELIKTDY